MTEAKRKKPPKIPFDQVAIQTWSPDHEGGKHIAMFVGHPIFFYGSTSEEAAQIARDWRTEEMAKEQKKRDDAKKAGERMKAARQAKKAPRAAGLGK